MGAFRYIGYALFFVVWVVIGLYLTFPWDVAKERLFAFVKTQTGVVVTASSLEPDWVTGIDARDVKIYPKQSDTPFKLDRLQARVKLLPLLSGKKGFTANAPLARGTIDADIVIGDDTIDIDAELKGVQLELVTALRDAKVPLSGRATVDADLVWGVKDPKLTNGNLSIKGANFTVEKGTKLGMFPLPRDIGLGSFDISVPIKDGKARLKAVKIAGADVEITADGSITLMRPFDRSTLEMSAGLKPTPALLNSDPLIKSLLKNVERYKGSDGFYGYHVSGTVKRPRFKPTKR